jgi:hypothetical protein
MITHSKLKIFSRNHDDGPMDQEADSGYNNIKTEKPINNTIHHVHILFSAIFRTIPFINIYKNNEKYNNKYKNTMFNHFQRTHKIL